MIDNIQLNDSVATSNVADNYHRLQRLRKGIKMASLNINGIRGHHDELKNLLANTGIHVLALNETKVDKDMPDQIVDIGIVLCVRIKHREGVE